MKFFDVTIDSGLLSELQLGLAHIIDSEIFPNTSEAMARSAVAIQSGWKNWVRGTGSLDGIDDIEHPDNKLSNTIKISDVNDYTKRIHSTDPKMAALQEGHKEFDMKTKYPYGRKSRVSKKGIPYLIIPFRWGTPNEKGGKRAHFRNVIPPELYFIAKTFQKSKIMERRYIEQNYRGEAIERHTYKWGDRILKDMTEERNAVGMVRMENKGGYFTFRIISAASPKNSWIRYKGGVKGIDIEGALKRTYENKIQSIVEDAIKKDLANIETM